MVRAFGFSLWEDGMPSAGLYRRAQELLAQRTTSTVIIIPLSSCFTTWQWKTNRPTLSGLLKGMIIFASPGFPFRIGGTL